MSAENVRREVMLYLAERPGLKLAATAVLSHVKGQGHSVGPDEVEAALSFLTHDGWIGRERLGAASTYRYTALPRLILAHESGEL